MEAFMGGESTFGKLNSENIMGYSSSVNLSEAYIQGNLWRCCVSITEAQPRANCNKGNGGGPTDICSI